MTEAKLSKLILLSNTSEFIATLNPNSIKRTFGISYTNEKSCTAMGKLAPKVELNAYKSEKLSFELLLDTTGSIGNTSIASVPEQIANLKLVTYNYYSSDHEPSPVLALWGTMCFLGRLTSMDISYTLFSSSGVPLRANVTLNFDEYLSDKEQEALAKKSSPDLTHIITFKSGDTLPLLCQKIYKDSSYYIEIAKVNKLSSIREIKPGTKLYFPPLN